MVKSPVAPALVVDANELLFRHYSPSISLSHVHAQKRQLPTLKFYDSLGILITGNHDDLVLEVTK